MVAYFVVEVRAPGRRFAENHETWAQDADEARRKVAARLTAPAEIGQAFEIHR